MSPRPIARSADLSRLRDEGYTLSIRGGNLVVADIPHVDHEGAVHDDGAVVMALNLGGETTVPPSDHTTYFMGRVPCDRHGVPLTAIINNRNTADLGDGLVADCYMSAKPSDGTGYRDFHHKVVTYIGHIAGPASALDPTATARRFRAPSEDDEGPFHYADTASSRAGIDALNEPLASEVVGIIGQGGTGDYLLDFVAKTRVAGIHIFDSDLFLTHNAFRSPGAASREQLNEQPLKVDYMTGIYSNMRSGIVAHPYRIDETNVHELRELTFVFVAIDDAPAKRPIIEALVGYGIPFVDVGMGVEVVDGRLTGLLRSTLVTPEAHAHATDRIPTVSALRDDDDYRSGIQIAELNAMNAVMAVLQWKRYRGLVADALGALQAMFSIASNRIVNDEIPVDDSDEHSGEAA